MGFSHVCRRRLDAACLVGVLRISGEYHLSDLKCSQVTSR